MARPRASHCAKVSAVRLCLISTGSPTASKCRRSSFHFCISATAQQVVTLDVLAGQFAQQHVHLMIEAGVIGRRTDNQSAVTEHVADDIRVVGLRHVIHHDVLHTGLRGSTGNHLGGTLGVAIHRSVANHESLLGLVTAHLVVHADDLLNILVPHRSMGSADIVELHTGQLLQRVLHGSAVFAHDVRIVTYHLQPEGVAVDLCIHNAAVQGAETAEGIAREEHILLALAVAQGHHGLGPVHHRGEHEAQRVAAQLQGVAVLHLHLVAVNAIEALHHAKGLLVADDLHVGIIFLDQGQRAAVVGLHVVDHQIVDRTVAYHLLYILNVRHEEVHLHSVDEAHLLVVYQVRVITDAIGQGPQALE